VQPTRSYTETAVIPPECAEIKEHMAQWSGVLAWVFA